MRRSIKTVVLCIVCLVPTIAGAQAPNSPAISFATVEQGRAVLTNRDDFVSRLSPFDRAARMKTDLDVTEQEYLAFVAKNVLEWTPEGRDAVQSAFDGLTAKLSGLNLPFPKTILFIKTTGDEEGHAEYTRANAIILPQNALAANRRSALQGTIAHELFHVLSRNAPDLRERAYAVIGFQPCGEVPFPPALAARKITNPDAPMNDHCIRVESDRTSIWVVPILFSKSNHYNRAKGGEFFDYLDFEFLVVEKSGSHATYDPSKITLLKVGHIQGFYEQVGRNTDYIIHPEEILADNFEYLLIGKADLPSPDVQRRLAAALRSQ
ncbi:MAG: hypothetical protein WB780_04400 [Candidatus Acidiferrales bacterium]